jgi:hypothetical protein
MRVANAVNYEELRFCLLYDPKCTKKAMRAVNERTAEAIRESPEKVDLGEPFGAILWRKRTGTGYPLCLAAALTGTETDELVRLEMGWALPEKKRLDGILAAMGFYYGFTPVEYFTLIRLGDEYRKEKPMDLSSYLGLDVNEKVLQLMPQDLYEERKPIDYERCPIRVNGESYGSGIVFPATVIWPDGRVFRVEGIDSAQERARFATGGIGVRFSCRIGGKQRVVGYEKKGDWFLEKPIY